MGRSQGVVFGYGAIVPTQDFVRLFPGSFEINQQSQQWEAKNIDTLNLGNLIRVFYSVDELTDKIFIATKSAVDYGFEKGDICEPFSQVNMNLIIQEGNLLAPWLTQNFPNAPFGFMMYGYYTS